MGDQNKFELFSKNSIETHSCLNISFTEETIETFFQDLPTYNVNETAKQLYDFLICLNCHHIDLNVRYKITQAIILKTDYVFDCLFKKYFLEPSHDLNVQQPIVFIIESLFFTLKKNYLIIFNDQLKKFFQKKEILAYCLAHCLRVNLKILFIHCLLYDKAPGHLWLECHQLYQLAEDKNLLNKKLSAIDKEIAHLSILDWYKHLILFSISNPYRLCTQELLLLYHAIPYWTTYIKIEPAEEIQEELFFIDFSKDVAPIYTFLNLSPLSNTVYTLTLTKLNTYLENILNDKNQCSSTEKNLSKNLIKQLINSWSYFSNRDQDRAETNQPAQVFIGISGIIQALSPEPSVPSSLMTECSILNESPGGFCLEFNIATLNIKRPKTGDLLGLSTILEAPNYQISVGVVRWVKQVNSATIQCGLQLLGHHPLALAIQITGINEQELIGEPQDILFIPEMSTFGRNESIVSPGMPFKPGMKVKIQSSHVDNIKLHPETTFILSDLVLSTNNFKQFFIEFPDSKYSP